MAKKFIQLSILCVCLVVISGVLKNVQGEELKVPVQVESSEETQSETSKTEVPTEETPKTEIFATEPPATKAPATEVPKVTSSIKQSLNEPIPLSPDQERAALYEELRKQSEILKAQENVLKIVAKLIEPSVVFIKSDIYKLNVRGEQVKLHEEGSGIIFNWKQRFFILTNFHVIQEAVATNITIQYTDKRNSNPIQIWYDKETDIAVLEVKERDLIPAKIGDSNLINIGDFVLAVGSPFGLNSSVTFGIISAKGRRALNLNTGVNLQDFIQTDSAINPGNSGGPLVNLQGEVIAMNTAIASNSGTSAGIAFSIPINMVKLIAAQLIVYGKARRAYLGVDLDHSFSSAKAKAMGIPNGNGAYVSGVHVNSPAYIGNITKGDIILKFGDFEVDDEKHLYNLVNLTGSNQEVPVTVFRNGKIYVTKIKLQER